MYLEYDWTYNCFRPRLGHTFIAVRGERHWESMAEAKLALNNAGMTIGRRTASRSWEIKLIDA